MYTPSPQSDNREKSLYLWSQIVWYTFSVVEAFLLLRFFLKLLGANPGAAFTQLVYTVWGALVSPFHLIFRSSSLPVSGSVFEWDIILAIVVYWLLAMGIIRLFGLWRKVSKEEAHDNLEQNAKI